MQSVPTGKALGKVYSQEQDHKQGLKLVLTVFDLLHVWPWLFLYFIHLVGWLKYCKCYCASKHRLSTEEKHSLGDKLVPELSKLKTNLRVRSSHMIHLN